MQRGKDGLAKRINKKRVWGNKQVNHHEKHAKKNGELTSTIREVRGVVGLGEEAGSGKAHDKRAQPCLPSPGPP